MVDTVAPLSRDQWRGAVADAWTEANFLIVTLPQDENCDEETRAVRDRLVAPDGRGARASGPPRDRTFCCRFRSDTPLWETVAMAGDCHVAITAARTGEPADAFYGAVWGGAFVGESRLANWIRTQYTAMRAEGFLNPRHLHIAAFVACRPQSLRGYGLPEGVAIAVAPPDTPGDLAAAAEIVVGDLWPEADMIDRAYLHGALLDMASGRLADLAAAADALATRGLSLSSAHEAADIAWDGTDASVREAAEALAALGIVSRHAPTFAAPPSPDQTEDLWSIGLWRPAAEDWYSGLTSRAWAAVGATAPIVIEHAVLDVLARCLPVERLCRQILRQLLADARTHGKVEDALSEPHLDGTTWRDRILGRRSARMDADAIAEATFGQTVAMLRYATAAYASPSLFSVLDRVVRARNDAAHRGAPSRISYRHIVRDAAEAMRLLPSLLN